MIEIRDFNHARALLAEGQTDHADIRDPHSAIMWRDACEARLTAMGDEPWTASAEVEADWLRDEVNAIDCDWLDSPSPECESHLY